MLRIFSIFLNWFLILKDAFHSFKKSERHLLKLKTSSEILKISSTYEKRLNYPFVSQF
jgi:hypothetical protein